MRKCLFLVVMLCLSLAPAAFGQITSTTGGIDGRVIDPQGAAVPGAKVSVVGQSGVATVVTTNDEGLFEVKSLNPGNYSVTVEMQGFKTARVERVEVLVGRSNSVTASLEVGEASAVVNVTDVAQIDQSSTAVGANLNDQLYQNIPVDRSVSSLFYLSAGVTSGLGGGQDNPSISGGSALDNLYVADGVNITDSAFGGIGTFSRNYGALGTGINTSYIKEVQVKTGGFEPQYGQSTGGIVNIITKSGGNAYHGAVYGYARPNQLEATRRQRDEFRINKAGTASFWNSQLAQEQYDAGVDFSGPVWKDHIFFFGSFNPTIRRDIVEGAHRSAFQIEQGSQARIDSGLFNLLGEHVQRYRTLNYSFKLDYNINPNHTLAFSIFGDPTKTNRGAFILGYLNMDNLTALNELDFGSRNMAVRYNGAFGSTNPATLSVTFSRSNNHFNEFGFDDRFNGILNRTDPVPTLAANAFQMRNTRGNYQMIGYGFNEPTEGHTNRFTIDGTKQASFLGTHTFGLGYQYQKAFYDGLRARSGPRFMVPSETALGTPLSTFVNPLAIGQLVDAQFSLRLQSAGCTLCPLYFVPSDNTNPTGFGPGWRRVSLQHTRGELGDSNFDTFGGYHAAYAQDTWRVNKYITAIFGLRWEQEDINGSEIDAQGATVANISNSFVGTRSHYTFTGQWSPRFGVTVDPMGRGKTKVYYNFGRYHEFLPLDAAERSLSLEQDFNNARYAPAFRIGTAADGLRAGQRIAVLNEFNAVVPVIDAEHSICDARPGLISGVECAWTFSANDPTQVVNPGTKLGYLDEHVVGFEQQLPRNFTLSVRYLDRRIKRIIEDAAVLPVEAFNSGVGQTYFLGNINSTLDAAVNLDEIVNPGDGANCFTPIIGVTDFQGNALGNVCFGPRGINPTTFASILGPDGTPDGFVDPVRIYRAIEVEVNKRFSDNWQLLSNVRFSSLRGNYEGHLRNDNGQTDPAISSLFDFTEGQFNQLGNQFDVGPLNSDRRVVANVYGSYTLNREGFGGFLHGMTLGANLRGESGLPISEYLAHPAYNNQGEIPIGGRGKLGRTSPYYRLDLHVDYPWSITETTRLSFIADFFNVTNNRAIQRVDEYREVTAGQLNADFFTPRAFYPPFNMRLGLRLEF
jgi:hypothetical protein